jgi:hypothetical protein
VPWLLVAGGLLSIGLITALYAYRRRIWVVVEGGADQHGADRGGADGRTLYRVVGRAFQREDVAEAEHARIAAEIATRLDAASVDRQADRQGEGVDA